MTKNHSSHIKLHHKIFNIAGEIHLLLVVTCSSQVVTMKKFYVNTESGQFVREITKTLKIGGRQKIHKIHIAENKKMQKA